MKNVIILLHSMFIREPVLNEEFSSTVPGSNFHLCMISTRIYPYSNLPLLEFTRHIYPVEYYTWVLWIENIMDDFQDY